jgi:hypothetical protein
MNKKVFFILIILRIALSVILTKPGFSDDEIFYSDLIKNLLADGNLSYYRPDGILFIDYQWFASIFYLPFVILFENKIVITLINNISYLAIVFLLSKIWNKDLLQKFNINLFLLIFLFFPPMFDITNYMYSESVFVFILGIIIYLYFQDYENVKNKYSYFALFIMLIICFINTRPVSFIFLIIFIFLMILDKKYSRIIWILSAVLTAMLINNYIHIISVDDSEFKSNRLVEAIYYTNTIYSDGQTDSYIKKEHYKNDSTYLLYKNNVINDKQLLYNLISQIRENPGKYLIITKNKLINYLFRLWPESWSSQSGQNIFKKLYELFFNGVMYILIFLGLKSSDKKYYIPKSYKAFFILLFIINLSFHLLIISRYRYNLPVVFVGIPFVYIAIANIMNKIKEKFKN